MMGKRGFLRGPLLWGGIGVLFAVTIGPILTGAFGSIFWSLPSDGPRSDRSAAERLFYSSEINLQEFPITDLSLRVMGPDRGKCPGYFGLFLKEKLVSDADALDNITEDLRHAKVERIVDYARQGSLEYLTRLPRAALGALDNCVTHSLLAPMCASMTRTMLEKQSARLVRDFEQDYLRTEARADAEHCALWSLASKASPKIRELIKGLGVPIPSGSPAASSVGPVQQ